MSEQTADPASGFAPTGDPGVDAAVTGLDDLEQQPLEDHHDRLRRAHEQLHAELSRDHESLDR